jgi:hypothetical protein
LTDALLEEPRESVAVQVNVADPDAPSPPGERVAVNGVDELFGKRIVTPVRPELETSVQL